MAEADSASLPEQVVEASVRVTIALDGVKKAEATPLSVIERVNIGRWQVVRGEALRQIALVMGGVGPVGSYRANELPGVVAKDQELTRTKGKAWGLVVKVWYAHKSNKVLWTLSGVWDATGDDEVVADLKAWLDAMVGVGTVSEGWRKSYLSCYMIVKGVAEESWVKLGCKEVRVGNNNVEWGRRAPLVVSRAYRKLAIKLEMANVEAMETAVRWRILVGDL